MAAFVPVYVHRYACLCMCTYMHMFMCMCECVQVSACVCTCLYVSVCVWRMYVSVCVCVCTYICTYVCMSVCVCVYECTSSCCLCMFSFICLTYPPICLSIYLPPYQTHHVSIYVSIICLSILLFVLFVHIRIRRYNLHIRFCRLLSIIMK